MADVLIPMGSRVVTGNYTGDGAAERIISLGFTPRLVVLFNAMALSAYNGEYIYSCAATPGLDATTGYSNTILSITSGGFKIFFTQGKGVLSNQNGLRISYLAV